MTIQERLKALLPEDKVAEADAIFIEMDSMFARSESERNRWKEVARKAGTGDIDQIQKLETDLASQIQVNAQLAAKLAKKDGEVTDVSKKVAAAVSQRNALAAERELQKVLGKYQIAPDSADDVFSLLAKNVKVVDDAAGPRVVGVIVKDGVEVDSTVEDVVKNWSQTSGLAKRVMTTSRTSGSGAPGSAGTAGTSKPWSSMSLQEQTKLYKENPEAARAAGFVPAV